MDPLAPKPFGTNKPAFKGFQGRAVPEKSQTLPAGMPALSGDILKQRLKTLHGKSNGTKPELQRSSGSIGKGSPKHSAPVISQKEITNRRDSMHKAPPPPTPDSKKNFDKTPEFLRKKLKPTGKVLSSAESEEKPAETNKVNSETEEKHVEQNENGKSNFRKSLLMFEQTPPSIAPKPRSRSKLSNELCQEKKENSNENQEVTQEQNKVNSENLQGTADATVSESAPAGETVSVDKPELTELENIEQQSDSNNSDITNDLQEKDEQNSEQCPKPQSIVLPNIPDGLSEWMNCYVKNNKNLIKLDSEQQNVPPVVLRELKNIPQILNKNSSDDVRQEGNEDDGEIYDDVQTGTTENEEVYDDVDSARQTAAAHPSDTPSDNAAATSEEVYDDVNNAAPVVQEELYDDIAANAQPDGEEVYDDVQTQSLVSGMSTEFADDEIQGEGGEDLYEPVETIATYVPSNSINKPEAAKSDSLQSNNHQDKASKKKEEKDRKEREKLEKKRREEAEKKLKKEEEERKKKEKEDRRRIEKERKSFNLKPDEDPVPIERHMAKCDIKAKGKDLSFCRGEYLDIISKNNCPKGKVLAQNSLGKLGYVSLKDLGIDKRKSLLETSSPVALGVAFGDEFYEKVNSQSEGLIVSLSSPRADESPVFQSNLSHFKQSAHSSPSSNRGDSRETEEGNPGEEIYEMVS